MSIQEEINKQKLKDFFEPREMEEIYQTEEDIKIRDTDIPERLQLRFKKYLFKFSRQYPTNTELFDETKWIFEHLPKFQS